VDAGSHLSRPAGGKEKRSYDGTGRAMFTLDSVGELESLPGKTETPPLRELFLIAVAEAEGDILAPLRRGEEHERDFIYRYRQAERYSHVLTAANRAGEDLTVRNEDSAARDGERVLNQELGGRQEAAPSLRAAASTIVAVAFLNASRLAKRGNDAAPIRTRRPERGRSSSRSDRITNRST